MIDIDKFKKARKAAFDELKNEVKGVLSKQSDKTYYLKNPIMGCLGLHLNHKKEIILIGKDEEEEIYYDESTFIAIAEEMAMEMNKKINTFFFAEQINYAERNHKEKRLKALEDLMLDEIMQAMKAKMIDVLHFNPPLRFKGSIYTSVYVLQDGDEKRLYLRYESIFSSFLMKPLRELGNEIYFEIAERLNQYN